MSGNNVKFFTYGGLTSNNLFGCTSLEKAQESNFKTEAQGILAKVKIMELQPDDRQRLNTKNGVWFCKVDNRDIAYLTLCNINYPERHAFGMMDELQRELEERVPGDELSHKDTENINKDAKKFVAAVLRRYDNLQELDKLYEAQHNVDQIQVVMNQNLQQVMKNVQDVEEIRGKSENMKVLANQFQKDSTSLAKQMYWRNMRLKIIIGLIILAVILYIVVPIAIKYSGNNSSDPASTANSSTTNSTSSTNTTTSNSTNGTLRF